MIMQRAKTSARLHIYVVETGAAEVSECRIAVSCMQSTSHLILEDNGIVLVP